jgi:predicted RNA-binding Zn-ribbon protein involved in translation (DUF1610 family)
MGRISKFLCPSCNKSWQTTLGHGIDHAVLENILDIFPPEIQKSILSDIEGGQIPAFEFNYRPAVCTRCRKVLSVPVIYLHRTKKTYSSVCPDCGNDVTIQSEDEKLICPHCQNSALSVEDIGIWD